MKTKPYTYYVLVKEWLYPTESGRDVIEETYDTLEDALKRCQDECEYEKDNYEYTCKVDSLYPAMMFDTDPSNAIGYIITPKNGLDEWFFAVRVIPINGMWGDVEVETHHVT